MGNAGRTRAQRDFRETAMIDGFERAVCAAPAIDRTGPRGDPGPIPTFAHRAEYYALRGAVRLCAG